MSTVSDQPKRKLEETEAFTSAEPDSKAAKTDDSSRLLKRGPISKAREIRLEQNRKAARQSRRRKKVMIEELQRSVIFFSRSNGVLKQQNDDLQRLVMNARTQVSQMEGQKSIAPTSQPTVQVTEDDLKQQAEANAVATQAVLESQGFPAATARAVAQTMNGTSVSKIAAASDDKAATAPPQDLPHMQPGATMQAMANFQQAAAVAMQQAVQGMQQIPGMTVSALTATAPSGANSSQAFNDTMAALAMQQAASAAGHPGFFQSGGFMPRMPWQQGQSRLTHPSSALP